MAQRLYIQDLAPNQLVEGVFTIQNNQLGLTRNGKPFLKCLLADRTGRAAGRMWNASEELFQTLPTDGFVEIEGQTQPYQGEMQIIIRKIRQAIPSHNDLVELLPSTEHDIDEMFGRIQQKLRALEHPSLRALAEGYLADEPLMDRFRQAPAAMQLHHAYLGGLLEHTLMLMGLAEAILPFYPKINGELVRFGLFLHDLGKCEELTWDAGFSYSDDGRLIGHIARGVIWLEDKARACAEAGTPIEEDLLRVLQHIILSHHGQPEFGALKIPSTPEAILINLIDNLDAKTHMALAAGRGEPNQNTRLGGNFTEKVWALGTRIYRPDPLAAAPADGSTANAAAAAPSPAPSSSDAAPQDGSADTSQKPGRGGSGKPKPQQQSQESLKGGLG